MYKRQGVSVRSVSFSPEVLFADCVESFRTRAEAKGLALVFNAGNGLDGVCRGDAFRIRQIAENLISNALKYTAGGSVTVTVDVTEGVLRLSVADTGPGMTEEDARRIFRAFTRLSGAQGIEGVGLGLSITRELVNLLGGEITLDTAPGRGSTFTVCLPVEAVAASGAVPVRSSQPPSSSCDAALPRDLSIAVIDDDPFQLQLACEMLYNMSGGHWQVCACSHTEELMVLLGERRFDIMFTDIEMPGVNGFDLVRRLERYRLPVVAMTAHDAIGDDEFLNAGFAARLSKPFTTESLSAVIARLCGCGGKAGAAAADTAVTVPAYGRFAPLVEFADGDRESELAILRQYHASTAEHLEVFRQASDNVSEEVYDSEGLASESVSAVAALGHKLIPVSVMIQSSVVPQLRALAAMRGVPGPAAVPVPKVPFADFRSMCGDIVRELEAVLKELDAILKEPEHVSVD